MKMYRHKNVIESELYKISANGQTTVDAVAFENKNVEVENYIILRHTFMFLT